MPRLDAARLSRVPQPPRLEERAKTVRSTVVGPGRPIVVGAVVVGAIVPGPTREEVKEVLLQVAVYAGAPAANSAFAIAKRTYKEMETEGKK